MVPVVDLSRRATPVAEDYVAAVRRIMASGHVLLGPELEAFEAELAASAHLRYAVCVSSGAAALQLGLAALGVVPGDEVIVPGFTAVPTASAVCALGAVPVPVDVHAATGTLDPDAARAARTARTAAVVPVHLYGRPAILPDIGVPVLDDAAQAQGAVGGPDESRASAATAYSFYPTKNLGGIGDGGAILTDDPTLAAAVRLRARHGMTAQYVHTVVSQNFRMSEMEAAWLRLLLPGLRAGNERRRAIAAAYRTAAPDLDWQAPHPRHVYHLAVVRLPDRERAGAQLAAAGVATAVHYPLALTQQPAYRRFGRLACPQSEAWASSCVTVPCFPELTDDEVATVCGALEGL